jgi:hypothetical protein
MVATERREPNVTFVTRAVVDVGVWMSCTLTSAVAIDQQHASA